MTHMTQYNDLEGPEDFLLSWLWCRPPLLPAPCCPLELVLAVVLLS